MAGRHPRRRRGTAGRVTIVVTTNQSAPSGSLNRSKYSVTDGVRAERDAVLAQVARANLRGHDLERAALRAGARRRGPAESRRRPPRAAALPIARPRRPATSAAPAATCGVAGASSGRANRSSRVCMPASVSIFSVLSSCHEMRRRAGSRMIAGAAYARHCSPAASSFAGIPRVGDLAAGRVDRDVGVVALRRRDHPPAPVLADDRHPVAGEIDRRAARGVGGGAPRRRGRRADALRGERSRAAQAASAANATSRPATIVRPATRSRPCLLAAAA